MFESYQASYEESLERVRSGLAALDATKDAADSALVASLHQQLKEAEQSLKSLDLEARSMGMEKRREVKRWKDELKELSKEFDQRLAVMNRRGLLGEAAQQRAVQKRLQETERKIEEGTDMVRAATRQALESEQIGGEILNDLAAQRETIQRTRANMGIVGGELNQAGSTIKDIEKPNCVVQ
ncbi:unnamed protein product [Amoebophrya sp. A25]|nr:unnamed protein product [Amoebophrya sp. A25]|eukprot:GSA25T00004020001.1